MFGRSADGRERAHVRRSRRVRRAGTRRPAARVEGTLREGPLAGHDEAVADQRPQTCRIVGVGASAGGLDAFTELLSHLPADAPLALVLVSHLDPAHPSSLAALLARASRMPVVEIVDGMGVEPGRAYVIPPNAGLTIVDGILHLVPRTREGSHGTIDRFFRALAEDSGTGAIGVILSGTGSDGTLGLAAIKEAGGLTFAQDPPSAQYDSMPRSAVRAGAADLVLPPTGIARELARIAAHPEEARLGGWAANEVETLSPVLARLHADTGVDFTQYRESTLRRRIARRMLVHKCPDLAAYLRLLDEQPDELHELYNDVLISVTGFFRDADAFEALQQRVFAQFLDRRRPDEPIRVWSTGCATGEETYSLAIALMESLGPAGDRALVQVFGSDVSAPAVRRARAGLYPRSIALDVSPERLRRFFVQVDDHYQIQRRLRDVCVFAEHDLLKDPPFSDMDLIACRNVLIYLEPAAQRHVMSVLHYALKPGGVLLLGASETIGPLADLFEVVDKKHKIYAKKVTSVRLSTGFTGLPRRLPAPALAQPHPTPRPTREGNRAVDVQRAVDRILLGRYAPAAVLVNEAMEILQFRGHTSRYLEPAPGHASLNILKMAREGLLQVLRASLDAARRKETAVRRERVPIRHEGALLPVNVEIVPVAGVGAERSYLIIFEEVRPVGQGRGRSAGARAAVRSSRRPSGEVRALRQELEATKDFLQSIVQERETANEELRAANEEILSSNEELQSTNEELETAKEELQSVNEELVTVNDELRHRNVELGRLGDDLANVLTGANVPIVLVDANLSIRRFTPRAEPLFDLVAGDVGRPLGQVRPSLDIADLPEMCTNTIETASASEQETRDRDGRWWRVTVRPYRTADNRVAGAVIALADITALRERIDAATVAQEHSEGIVNTVRSPLLVLDADLRVKSASVAFFDSFPVTPEQTIGRFIGDLGDRQWDVPTLRRMLHEVVEGKASFEGFEVRAEFEGIGLRTMLLNARQIYWRGQSTGTVLLAIEDVTERRRTTDALEAARAEAEAATRAKDEFLAVLSHELRTPLTAMVGWLHMLRAGKLDKERTRQALDVVDRNTRLQARLIDDLLDTSRIVADKLHVDPRPVDVVPAVEAAVELHRPAAEAKGLQLEVVLDAAPIPVLGDALRLQQVVSNLISNAVKFTPTGGRVTVRLAGGDRQVEIRVSDTGEGIAAELLPQIFSRFARGTRGSRRPHGGLGLGLSIVHRLVELHGGGILAESPGRGQGATFTVTLPRAPAGTEVRATGESSPSTRAKGPDGPPTRLDGLCVLVVEDEQDARDMIALCLQQQGAEVTAVGSAAQGLAALERLRPDVLVSDLAMPGENGYDFIRRVRALPADRGGRTPAAALSAYARGEDQERAVAAGYQIHVSKPIAPVELCGAVASLGGLTGSREPEHVDEGATAPGRSTAARGRGRAPRSAPPAQ